MEFLPAIKRAVEAVSLLSDKLSALGGRLDDLLGRAIRISNAVKQGLKITDSMFGYDLQHFRHDAKALQAEVLALPNLMGAIEKQAASQEEAVGEVKHLIRAVERLHGEANALQDHAHLAHQYIRATDFKIEASYLVQELMQMTEKTLALKSATNRILLRLTSRA